jgi:alkylhydroperoxidase family enzyme
MITPSGVHRGREAGTGEITALTDPSEATVRTGHRSPAVLQLPSTPSAAISLRAPGGVPAGPDHPAHTTIDRPVAAPEELRMSGRGLERVAVRLLEAFTRQHWGYPAKIVPYLVAELGPVRAVRWVLRTRRHHERAVRTLGPLRTHLACATISMLNGCRYCTHGHALAVELHHLHKSDRLFPVDAATMTGWTGLPRAELRSKLRDALMRADLHLELIWVDRALGLADGGRPIDAEEARVAQLVSIMQTLNAVSIAGDPELDGAHDPLNKDARLKTRLATMRAHQR